MTPPLERPPHKIEALALEWPTQLVALDAAASAVGIASARLGELADSGFAPHYRIDGGPPLFRINDLKRWCATNLLQRHEGHDLPGPVHVIVWPPRVADFRKVPSVLREITDLCDITNEVRRSGIYFLCRDSNVVYVGKSINVTARLSDHLDNGRGFDAAYFLPWPRHDLSRIELALIQALRPPHNGTLQRDGIAETDPENIGAIVNPLLHIGGGT